MRRLLVALLIFAAAVGGYFGTAAYAQLETAQQVATFLQNIEAAGLEVRHGAVTFDLPGRRVDISDIALNPGGEGTARIGHISVIGYEETGGDRFRADRVEITDLVYDGPAMSGSQIQVHYGAPSIVVEQYEGPTHIDAGGSGPSRAAWGFFVASSAKRITMPSTDSVMTIGSGADAVRTEAKSGETILEQLSSGMVARATFAPSTLTREAGAKEDSSTGTMGRLSIETFNLAAGLGLFDAASRDVADKFQPIAKSAVLDGYSETFANGRRTSVGKMKIDDLSIDVFTINYRRYVIAAQKFRSKATTLKEVDDAPFRELASSNADLIDCIKFSDFEYQDIEFVDERVGAATIKLASISGDPKGDAQSLIVDGLSAKSPDGNPITMKHLAVRDAKPGQLLRFLAAATETGAAAHQSRAERLKPLQFLGAIEIDGLEGRFGKASTGTVKIDTLRLSWGDFIGPVPSRLAASLRVSGPLSLFGKSELFALLADSGKTEASVAFDVGLAWSEADRTITASPLSIEVGDAFSAAAKMALADVDKDGFFSADQAEAAHAFQSATLGTIDVVISDAGIYKMKLDQLADDRGTTSKAAQKAFIAGARVVAKKLVADNPDLEAASAAIMDFLSAPNGTLTLKLIPTDDLLVEDVIDASKEGDLPSLLEFMDVEATMSR